MYLCANPISSYLYASLYAKSAIASNIYTFLLWSTHRLIKHFSFPFFLPFRAHSNKPPRKDERKMPKTTERKLSIRSSTRFLHFNIDTMCQRLRSIQKPFPNNEKKILQLHRCRLHRNICSIENHCLTLPNVVKWKKSIYFVSCHWTKGSSSIFRLLMWTNSRVAICEIRSTEFIIYPHLIVSRDGIDFSSPLN